LWRVCCCVFGHGEFVVGVVGVGVGVGLLGLLRFWGWWWWDLQGGSKIGSKRKGNFKQLKLLACGKSVALGLLSGHVQAACSISAGGGGINA